MNQSPKRSLRAEILLAVILGVLASPVTSTANFYSGFYGYQVNGQLEPIYNVWNLQNASNLGTPLAAVSNGIEFSASFDDVFNNHWNLSLDLQDDYRVVMRTTSPNPNANIGSGNFIRWHLYGFDVPVQNVTKVAVPRDDRSTVTFDANEIWIAFNGLAAWSPYDSYTFQIVPVPEPSVVCFLAVGGGLYALICPLRRK